MNRRTLVILVLMAGLIASGCGAPRDRLRIVAAGGLQGVVADLVDRYRRENPDRAVELVIGGSVELARRVAAGELEADVLLLADGALFGELLQPEWTSFQLRWATDRMVLALSERSRVGIETWPDDLLVAGVEVGRADPERSAVGYRFEYVVRLHDRADPGRPIAERLLAAPPASPYLHAAALAEAVRVAEVEAALLYASTARDADLRTVELGPRIDLGAEQLAPVYAPVSVPSTDGTTPRPAAPIVHVVAVADGTPRREAALDFLRLALDPDGRTLLRAHGLLPVTGADRVFSFALPEDIETLLDATTE